MSQSLARKTAARPTVRRPADRLPGRAPEGVITAIVAVTGVVDEVSDNIVPGAFRRTFMHNPFLHPDGFCAAADGRFDNIRHELGAPEDIHNLDRVGHFVEAEAGLLVTR